MADGTDASPNVTVLTAAYNAAGFISRAVVSALSQDVPLEVLVVDDGSEDDTRAVVTAIAAADPRVRLLAMPANAGPSAARNAGIDAARGRWIAVLDADDAFLPGRLERLLATAARRSADIVADNFHFYDLPTDRTDPPALAPGEEELIDAPGFVARSRPYAREADFGLLKPMFNKAFLDRHGLRYQTAIRHGEDFLLILAALSAGGRYALTREPGYLYTSRSSGQSRTRVDYDAQVSNARRLSTEASGAGDERLAQALLTRAKALARLSMERRVEAAWKARQPLRLAGLALGSPHGAIEIVRRAKRRIVG